MHYKYIKINAKLSANVGASFETNTADFLFKTQTTSNQFSHIFYQRFPFNYSIRPRVQTKASSMELHCLMCIGNFLLDSLPSIVVFFPRIFSAKVSPPSFKAYLNKYTINNSCTFVLSFFWSINEYT